MIMEINNARFKIDEIEREIHKLLKKKKLTQAEIKKVEEIKKELERVYQFYQKLIEERQNATHR